MMLPYHVESWIWYGFVSLVVVTRFISRITLLGSPKKLQLEDYAMAFVFVREPQLADVRLSPANVKGPYVQALYTVLIIFLNIVLDVQTNLMTPDEGAHLTPQSIKDRRFGSKMVLLVEQCMCATIWGCKACLLLMYWGLMSWSLTYVHCPRRRYPPNVLKFPCEKQVERQAESHSQSHCHLRDCNFRYHGNPLLRALVSTI
jgi:hypothetical protein